MMIMIEDEFRSPGFASDLMIDGMLRAIIAILARNDAPSAGIDQERIYLSPVRLARVLEFVDAHLEHDINLADMAKIAGLSTFHFSRVFKLATGETPYHFVGSRRLSKARSMLSSQAIPLAELALSCGFANQSHFTAAFTKAMGISPGRYRKTASA